jgi:ATP-dependent Clp protease ATP-binding subunit ClpA
MNFEKYTDRARGFVQSAQSLAQREGHQQFSTEHLLCSRCYQRREFRLKPAV